MGLDDFLKDLADNIDWADIAGSFLTWLATNQNVVGLGIDAIIALVRIINDIRGMTESEAKEAFFRECAIAKEKNLLPMNF